MATLQKFKLLAKQCAVIGSPTRSPTTSPVIHIRRRKTLRMLLNRRFHHHHHRRDHSPDRELIAGEKRSPPIGKENLGVRLKLKDLFISTSPPSILGDDVKKVPEDEAAQRLLSAGGGGGLVVARQIGGGGGAMKPLSATIRQRLLMRRAWRPVLVAIPEQSP